MHELGIAASIFDIVRQYVPPGDAPRVRAVHVVVGTETAVLPESLTFCFEALVTGTPWALARLQVARPASSELAVRELELDDQEEP